MQPWVREKLKRAPARITTFWLVGFTNIWTVPAKIALPKHVYSYLMENTICGKLFFKSWCTRECWQSHGPLSHYCIFCAINFTGELSKWDASQQTSTVLITVFSFWMENTICGKFIYVLRRMISCKNWYAGRFSSSRTLCFISARSFFHMRDCKGFSFFICGTCAGALLDV